MQIFLFTLAAVLLIILLAVYIYLPKGKEAEEILKDLSEPSEPSSPQTESLPNIEELKSEVVPQEENFPIVHEESVRKGKKMSTTKKETKKKPASKGAKTPAKRGRKPKGDKGNDLILS